MMTASRHLTGVFDAGDTASQISRVAWSLASLVSMGAAAYHGSKRNGGSIGWGIWWGLMGGIFPVITPAIGVGQGFAVCKNNCRRS